MTSLKAFINESLWKLLRVAPTALYERQRTLVLADILEHEAGRGPGSGVRATPQTVAILLISFMASSTVLVAEARTKEIAESASESDKCGLTGKVRFLESLVEILQSDLLAKKVADVSISQTSSRAQIRYRKSPGKIIGTSKFSSGDLRQPVETVVIVDGDTLRAIAKALSQKTATTNKKTLPWKRKTTKR